MGESLVVASGFFLAFLGGDLISTHPSLEADATTRLGISVLVAWLVMGLSAYLVGDLRAHAPKGSNGIQALLLIGPLFVAVFSARALAMGVWGEIQYAVIVAGATAFAGIFTVLCLMDRRASKSESAS